MDPCTKNQTIWKHVPGPFGGFRGGSDGKDSACNAGDLGSVPSSEGPLEKEVATHSSILAWRIPCKEGPGGLQSMVLQKVGHDWVTDMLLFQAQCLWPITHKEYL